MTKEDHLTITRRGGYDGRKESTMENTTTITVPVPITVPGNLLTPKENTMPDGSPRRLTYTRREAAQALGVSLPTLDAFMNRRDNPLPRIRSGYKVTLIPIDALEKWVLEEANRCTGTAAGKR